MNANVTAFEALIVFWSAVRIQRSTAFPFASVFGQRSCLAADASKAVLRRRRTALLQNVRGHLDGTREDIVEKP
jgi:hypothetical protein